MFARMRKTGHGLVGILAMLAITLFGLSSSLAQNDAPAPSIPAALAAVLQSEPVRPVLLPDGRLLTLSGSELTLTSTRTGAIKPVTQRVTLPWVQQFASATVMPGGRVLIWGGVDAQGSTIARGMWFDPPTGDLTQAVNLPLAARAGGTATVLSDGRLLFTGGWSSQVDAMPQTEVWDPRTNGVAPVASALTPARIGQVATLLPDGRIQLSGGFDQDGKPVTAVTVFDPSTQQFRVVGAKTLIVPVNGMSLPKLMASVPAANATDFPADGVLSLRFSEPMDPRTINAQTITLLGPGGKTPVKVVGAEGGRLAFITPERDLYPSAHYTLFVQGVSSPLHAGLPFVAIDFAVATQGAANSSSDSGAAPANTGSGSAAASAGVNSAAAPASGSSSLPPAYVMTGTNQSTGSATAPCGIAGHAVNVLCRTNDFMDTAEDMWYPGQNAIGKVRYGNWRVNKPDITPQEIAYAELMLRVPGGNGPTGVTGRIELVDGKPLGNVDVSVGGQHARTDDSGLFKLVGVPAGHQTLFVDGTTANSKDHQYGQFVVGVDLKQGVVLPLSYRMYLPRILPRDVVNISSPTTRDMVITQPDMPGLEIRIPKGTVIRDHNGKIVTQLAIVPTPVDRSPFPTDHNFPIYFSIEPAGATVQNVDPTGQQGIQIIYPNYDHLAPGTTADFYLYHPEDGWKVYGQGHVSADGQHVAPDPGVDLVWVMGGSYYLSNHHPGDTPQGKPGGCKSGDPVDCFSGTLEEDQADIAISDIVPLNLTRYFHSMNETSPTLGTPNTFGDWRSNYDMWVDSNTGFTAPSVTLPDGNSLAFVQATALPGDTYTWTYTGSPSTWEGAILEAVQIGSYARCGYASSTGECYLLTLRDGTQYQFDRLLPNELTFIRDRFGNQLALTWNAGLLQQITSPSGRWISFTYNSSNTVATAADNTGRVWTYNYTPESLTTGGTTLSNDFLNSVTYPDSTAWSYTYDTSQTDGGWGGLLTITDRNGHQVVSNTYTGAQVTKQTLADGGTYTFAPGSNSMTITDPDGNATLMAFDPVSGYATSITRGYGTSLAETTTYARASTGLINSMTDALGRTTSYTYDSLGNVLSKSITGMQGTPSSVTEHFTWTPDYNQIASYKDGLGHTTTFSYTNGCLTQIKDPLGHTTNIACSVTGQPLTMTDALGHKMTLGYQAYDLRTITDALNRTTTLTIDPLGRLVAVQDPAGNISRRVYDPNNDWVDSMVDPMGKSTSIQYDGMGDVKAVTLPNGGSIGYTYDTSNRLITRVDALNQSESWTYYPLGEVMTHTDRKNQTTSYLYDALDRLSQTTYADGTNAIATYDAGNRLSELNDTVDGITEFGWNGLDDLAEEQTEPLGATQFQTVKYQYDAAGRRQWMLAGSQAQVNYTYDNANRLSKLAQGSATVTQAFDNANRLTKLTLPNGVAQSYGYDNASEVTGINYANGGTTLGNLAYTYDAAGRRISQSGTFASDNLPTATTANNTFDANNRQTGSNGTTLQYDADGNLIFDGTNTYVWNARNQLMQIKQGTSVTASFTYDPLGRRQSKTIDGATTGYLYDGLNPVQETQGTTVTPILEGLGVDQYFARAEASGEAYFLTDAQGSTIALTDPSGAIIQQYHYGPYGEANANNAGITNPYQYTGRENDGNGLYYYRARYYSPSLKRFISEDPMGFAGGQSNFYGYVFNSPNDLRDPLGFGNGFMGISPAEGQALAAQEQLSQYTDQLNNQLLHPKNQFEKCYEECAFDQVLEHEGKEIAYQAAWGVVLGLATDGAGDVDIVVQKAYEVYDTWDDYVEPEWATYELDKLCTVRCKHDCPSS